jgi:electron transport complex protein RnfE
MTPTATDIARDGLWRNNPGLVQLLGLCPLLAVSNSAVNALGLALATVLVLVLTNTMVALARPIVRPEIRIPAFVLIIASTVTVVELVMNAWLHPLYQVLGLFIPLIVTNCAIMGRAEAFASRQPVPAAALDGLAMGAGFGAVLLVLGGCRELIGHGTLFAGAAAMLGPWAAVLETTVIDGYRGFLPALLPPGAFIVLACLIAAKNAWQQRAGRVQPVAAEATP